MVGFHPMAAVKLLVDAFVVKIKPPVTKSEIKQTPVFPQTFHRLRPKPEVTSPKTKKRDNVFSQSRDEPEDRGMREMKTTHNAQTFPHAR
jgi:hypothetical protein